MPKQKKIEWKNCEQFKLTDGKVPDYLMNFKIVESIPEAKVNQEEAYKLTVTKERVSIEAV